MSPHGKAADPLREKNRKQQTDGKVLSDHNASTPHFPKVSSHQSSLFSFPQLYSSMSLSSPYSLQTSLTTVWSSVHPKLVRLLLSTISLSFLLSLSTGAGYSQTSCLSLLSTGNTEVEWPPPPPQLLMTTWYTTVLL